MRNSTLAPTSVGVLATALAGSLATAPDSRWYRSLEKPSWQPPTAAFPVVWTALYSDLAIVTAVTLEDSRLDGRERRAYRSALVANLLLNAGWSWLFWRSRKPWLAAAECLVLTVSSVDLVRRTARVRTTAGAALAPYAAWCGFATALSTAIARRN